MFRPTPILYQRHERLTLGEASSPPRHGTAHPIAREWSHDRGAICRRRCRWLRAQGRCRTVPGGPAHSDGGIRPGASARQPPGAASIRVAARSRQNPSDRIWTTGRHRASGTRGGKAGNLQLSGVHPYLLTPAEGGILARPPYATGPDHRETVGNHEGPPAPPAPGYCQTRDVAGDGGARLLRLRRRARERAPPVGVPPPCHRPLETRPTPAQPEGQDDMDNDGPAGGPNPGYLTPGPECASASNPKVGAVCGNSARTVLCGWRAAMRVPTAIHFVFPGASSGQIASRHHSAIPKVAASPKMQ